VGPYGTACHFAALLSAWRLHSCRALCHVLVVRVAQRLRHGAKQALLLAGFASVKVTSGEFIDDYQAGKVESCPAGARIVGASAAAHAYPTGALAVLQHLCAPVGEQQKAAAGCSTCT
jgi:hypothetical protein